jgi:hypothetical protein
MKCSQGRCLGHAQERTEEVLCTRCSKPRWVLVAGEAPTPTDYTCQRCRAVMAGKNAVDPLVVATEGQLDRLSRARAVRLAGRAG